MRLLFLGGGVGGAVASTKSHSTLTSNTRNGVQGQDGSPKRLMYSSKGGVTISFNTIPVPLFRVGQSYRFHIDVYS